MYRQARLRGGVRRGAERHAVPPEALGRVVVVVVSYLSLSFSLYESLSLFLSFSRTTHIYTNHIDDVV